MTDARFFDLTFDPDEDRILMVCTGTGWTKAMWLTRRITRRILEGFGSLLLRSSAAAARAPAALRTEVIVLEHLAALHEPAKETQDQESQDGGTDEAGSALAPGRNAASSERLRLVQPGAILLITKIDVQMGAHKFTLSFYQGEQLCLRTSFGRVAFHRLLSALDKLAQRAGWEMEPARGWLALVDRPEKIDHARLM